jgi:hypothetical protein
MFGGRVGVLVGSLGIATGVLAFLATGAAAATPIADWELQGNYASSIGTAQPLTDVGAGNVFETDAVNGLTRQVAAFPQHNGLQVSTTGSGLSGDYSAVLLVRLAQVDGYRRIFDSLDGVDPDRGVYAHNGKLDAFASGVDHESATPVIAPNAYVDVTIATHEGLSTATDETWLYANGNLVLDTTGVVFSTGAQVFRFFKDNTTEESAGKVACIRLYNGLLSNAEVAQIHSDGVCSQKGDAAAPPPAPAPTGQRVAALKKCKNKHKHSKKKRKKCKRRANLLPV